MALNQAARAGPQTARRSVSGSAVPRVLDEHEPIARREVRWRGVEQGGLCAPKDFGSRHPCS